MIVVQLTTDNREPFREYHKTAPWFGAAPKALLQGFAEMPGVEVHVVSCTQQPMAASPEKLAGNIWFHSLLVPKLGWLRTGYQGCIRAVRKKMRELKPDIVHGQGTERDCALSAIFSGAPNVTTIHGNMAELARLFPPAFGGYGWWAARLENFTLPRTAGVFCNSDYTASLVRPRARRIWRVANPIREAFFAPVGPAPRGDKPILLNIGVISPRKRQLELLELARELHETGLSFEIHFIGLAEPADPYAAKFLEQMRAAEQAGYARHLGLKSTTELIQCFEEGSGLIHFPSEEAFGLVVAEALARDVKFFGTRLGGIKDIAGDVPGAELLDVADWRGLGAALAAWLRAGAARPGGAAQLMRARYHPAVIARRHLEIYTEVLNSRS